MTPYRTETARKNLRRGIKKMEKTMSRAARVRRDFQLGRPPRALPEGQAPEPLHPSVLWQRATEALTSLRARMTEAGLLAKHAEGLIVYICREDPDTPQAFLLEPPGTSQEERQRAAFDTFASADVIALGMLFKQYDAEAGREAIFPYLFFGLNQRGMDILKKAAALQAAGTALMMKLPDA
jgi:hypothetical protein